LESVFYKSDENKNIELYEKLRKRGKINNRGQELIKTSNKGDEIKAKSSFVYENILQAISFVVTKIEVMKKYSVLTNEELAIVKNMNLKTRLININQRLLMIKNVMDGFEEIKEMAR
jgi:GTP cyclohydrolase II